MSDHPKNHLNNNSNIHADIHVDIQTNIQTKNEAAADYFLTLIDQYADFLQLAGKKVWRSGAEEGKELFRSISPSRRQTLLTRLERDMLLFQELLAEGHKLTDSKKFLSRYFTKSGNTPCSDIFDKMADGDVVEVYNFDQVHIFQNLNLFDWVSATLEEVFCLSWCEVFARDPHVTESLSGAVQKLMSGEMRTTFAPDNPWHLVEEVQSDLMMKFYLQMKFMSPLFAGPRVAAFIAVSQCRHFESN